MWRAPGAMGLLLVIDAPPAATRLFRTTLDRMFMPTEPEGFTAAIALQASSRPSLANTHCLARQRGVTW
jgi:hypothetical protein